METAMQERDFFDERTEQKQHTLVCPHCSQSEQYTLTWVVRRKRQRLNSHASDDDRARFAKARSYMLRKDDLVACRNIRCRKRFEVAGIQSVAFLDDAPQGALDDRAARIRAAFGRR
jgi:hypothetical protein